MTPSEMATWLARETEIIAREEGNSGRQSREAIFDAIVDWMRQQPTDAQKIEALKDAGAAALLSQRYRDRPASIASPASLLLRTSFRSAANALRLLGIEDEA